MIVDVFIPFISFISHYTQTEFKQTCLRAFTRVLHASLARFLARLIKRIKMYLQVGSEIETESMEIENWKGKCCHLYGSEKFSQFPHSFLTKELARIWYLYEPYRETGIFEIMPSWSLLSMLNEHISILLVWKYSYIYNVKFEFKEEVHWFFLFSTRNSKLRTTAASSQFLKTPNYRQTFLFFFFFCTNI